MMQNFIKKQDNDRQGGSRIMKVKTLNNYNRLNFNLQTLFGHGQNQRFKTMKEEDWVKKETKEQDTLKLGNDFYSLCLFAFYFVDN